MFQPKYFDIPPSDWVGCSGGLDAFRFFLKKGKSSEAVTNYLGEGSGQAAACSDFAESRF